jgi:hypothetical protein
VRIVQLKRYTPRSGITLLFQGSVARCLAWNAARLRYCARRQCRQSLWIEDALKPAHIPCAWKRPRVASRVAALLLALCSLAVPVYAQRVAWTPNAPTDGVTSYRVVVDSVALMPDTPNVVDPVLGFVVSPPLTFSSSFVGPHLIAVMSVTADGRLSVPVTVSYTAPIVQPPSDPCVAAPLIFKVTQWENVSPGSRQFRYQWSGSGPITITLTPTGATAVNPGGCTRTVTR